MRSRLHRTKCGRMACLVYVLALVAGCGSDSDPSGSSGPSSEKCAEERDRVVRAVRRPLQEATDKVMSSLLVMHRNALRPTGQVLRRVEANDCVGDSAALDILIQLAGKFDIRQRQIRRANAAFGEWARSMGSPEAEISLPPDPCDKLRQEVRASYRIIREPEVGGVQISLEILLENNSSQRVDLFHGGRVRATHVRPDDRTRIYGWGGSSADFATVAPENTSTSPVDLLPQTYPFQLTGLHLFSNGGVDVYDVGGSSGPCKLEISKSP